MFFTFPTFLATAHDPTAPTILGWTPGIRALVGGRVLPCGCLVGIYDTWKGETVTIVDSRGEQCGHIDHRDNAVIKI